MAIESAGKEVHPASETVESAAYVYNCARSDVHATTCAIRLGDGGSGCRVKAQSGRSRCLVVDGAKVSLKLAGTVDQDSVLHCEASGT